MSIYLRVGPSLIPPRGWAKRRFREEIRGADRDRHNRRLGPSTSLALQLLQSRCAGVLDLSHALQRCFFEATPLSKSDKKESAMAAQLAVSS
jgi:hypothetical protein